MDARDGEDARALLSDTDADGALYQRRDGSASRPAAAPFDGGALDALDDLDIDDDDDDDASDEGR